MYLTRKHLNQMNELNGSLSTLPFFMSDLELHELLTLCEVNMDAQTPRHILLAALTGVKMTKNDNAKRFLLDILPRVRGKTREKLACHLQLGTPAGDASGLDSSLVDAMKERPVNLDLSY